MFGFFRRQSKKIVGNGKSKKSKNLLNDIQCVPVDKYEIEFYRADNKPLQESSTTTTVIKNENARAIMGGSESTNKKPAQVSESADDKSTTDSCNNNVYSKPVYKPELESQWAKKLEQQKKADSCKQKSEDTLYNTTSSPQNVDSRHDPPNQVPEIKPQHENKLGDEKPRFKVYTRQSVCDKEVTSSKPTAVRTETTRTHTDNADENTTKTIAEEKCEPYDKKVVRSRTNDVEKNPNNAFDDNRKGAAAAPTTKPILIIGPNAKLNSSIDENAINNSRSNERADGINERKSAPTTIATKTRNDNAPPGVPLTFVDDDEVPAADERVNNVDAKRRHQFAEMARDDSNDCADNFGTAPSSSTEREMAMHARRNDTENSTTCRAITDGNYVYESVVDVNIATAESVEKDARQNDTRTGDISGYDEKILENPAQRSNTKLESFESTKKPRTRVHKKPPIQIPDITITESSDSEGDAENETESEDGIENYRENGYARTFPSVLYDISEVEEPFSDASDMEFSSSYNEDEKRNIVQQESKFQEQIKILKYEIEIKDTENMQLRDNINDLQRDITNKTWGMDDLHAELASFQTEADCVRKKLLKVEEDLNKYKTKNMELNEELLKKLGTERESDFKRVSALQDEIEILNIKIIGLETKLETVQKEREELRIRLIESEAEQQEKIKTLEIALDDALKQKQEVQAHIEEEYEKLRTVHSDREQQLLNDFEWKLREVELTCKRKLEDKDKNNEEKLEQHKKQLENEIFELKAQIKAVEKIKSYEAEVTQLRGLTQEQQRSLRMATRTTEQLHTNERTLNEEVDRLRTSLEKERSHLATVQNIHSREMAEKDRKHSLKIEQQKNELNSQWEDKIRREILRLKLEMEKMHKEEKRRITDEATTKTDTELKQNNLVWEKKLFDSKKELENVQQRLTEEEESYRKELLRLQTNSDRDMLELRRKLDKMDLAYQEQLEKKQEKHEQEIETLREEYEKKIQQSEQNWSQQVSSTRATLELVKEQLQRENENQLEALNQKYMSQFEEQYKRLINEKEETIQQVQEKYTNEMYALQNQLNEELKIQETKENELTEITHRLKDEIKNKRNNEQQLEENITALRNTVSELRGKLAVHENLTKEADTVLKKRESDHTETISQMKEFYENKIKYLQSEILCNEKQKSPKEQSCETNEKPEEYGLRNSVHQSKSSRRRAKGRHKSQKASQNRPHLTQQFSTSSL